MTGHEIRDTFLNFFAARGHRVVRSSSLVPAGDPTLLFTNAGMNQFKDVFLGLEKRDYSRAATSQKCVRAGGKHNDLENVGYTRRHHTFFEMLGNFSFGDYFKAEAIEFAWDLVTKVYGLEKDRLYVTVFREDDDAELLWQKVAGVPKSRIFRMDEKDNFWQMGETGPCGPCSEIHYDFGPHAAEPGREQEEFPLDGGGRFVEIWNLVFMQFDRSAEGLLTPLPRPSIDTGMGLERVAAVLQGKLSNYETDLIEPVRERARHLIGPKASATTLNIAADHARATAFLIHDGVVPSNEGRGYVLRKIMRRAIRHARRDGAQGYFLADLTRFVAEHMKPAYPEMLDSVDRVARIASDEEHRYATTFAVAEKIFHDEAKAASGGVLPGAAAFKLYDTYGLGLDEQADMARELGLAIDQAGFEAAMEAQRTRARASWKGAEKAQVSPVYQELLAKGQTVFVGYDHLEADATVIGVLDGEVVLDQTPFYAESGGQVGDRGALYSKETGEKIADVLTTYRPVPGLHVHKVRLHAPLQAGEIVTARVDAEARAATMRNHTSTHLLQAALQRVLGGHVKQAGSVVEPERLRFDFTHYAAVQPNERAEIEQLINREVLKNAPVITEVMPIDQALESGAMALFGEKYGDQVRVVTVDDFSNGRPFSRELCGGTHVKRTGDIGLVKITYEGSISAGVRRIEAVSGPAIADYYEGLLREKQETVAQLEEQKKQLERRLEEAKTQAARAMLGELESTGQKVKNIRVLSAYAPGLDRAQLRTLTDMLRNKYGSGVVALASGEAGAISIVVGVTKDLTQQVHAGKLAGLIASKLGGKGGGRPDMAEAGAADFEHVNDVMRSVYTTVEGML
jgi:alanyl-tRNA synthetase